MKINTYKSVISKAADASAGNPPEVQNPPGAASKAKIASKVSISVQRLSPVIGSNTYIRNYDISDQ
ncbi:hypothetical protein [Cupriavidus sp. CuC1]|uniref:hypothetical protein n=1 Tax=Cupriavidus sp. CuC1 TaxID=3373131 RepID=UPI0037D80D59